MITINSIKKITADFFYISVDDIDSRSRKGVHVLARQICHYLCRKYRLGSLTFIGDMVGARDHATVMHSINMVSDMIYTDYKYSGMAISEILRNVEMVCNAQEFVRHKTGQVINYDFSLHRGQITKRKAG